MGKNITLIQADPTSYSKLNQIMQDTHYHNVFVVMEDKEKRLWLYALDMDMMIHGGHTLPPDMLKDGNRVKKILYTMMAKAAVGEF